MVKSNCIKADSHSYLVKNQNAFNKALYDFFGINDESNTTKKEIRSSSISMTVIIVFVVLYLGIVFVISGAAIIGLKMLSDSIDSASHFMILKNIGASTSDRKKALFTRVFSFYMFPLALAVLNTIFGVRFVKDFMSSIGMINMGQGIIMSLIIMVLIYGGYFLTTYEGCRKIVGI